MSKLEQEQITKGKMGNCCDNCTDQNFESMLLRNKVQMLIGSLILIAVYLSYRIYRCQNPRRNLLCELFPLSEFYL